jgi:hypothetical protein
MAIKISNTTVIDNSRNLVNIENLSSSGVSTIGEVEISSGIITSTDPTGIVTYYGDGSKLLGISVSGVGGVLNVGGRTGVNTINVSSGSTTLLTRTGLVDLNI